MKALLSLLSATLLAVSLSAKVSETFSKTYPLSKTGTIELSNVNGSIEIKAWDKAEVSLVAVKSADDEDGLKAMQVKVDSSADSLKVRTEHENHLFQRNGGSVEYTLQVPATVKLDAIKVVNSKITISEVLGSIRAETVNGNVHVSGIASGASLHTVNGKITVSVSALSKDSKIELKTVNGSCQLSLPAGSEASLSASTVNGRITCALPVTIEKSDRRSLKGMLGNGGAAIHLSSVNGNLSIEKQ